MVGDKLSKPLALKIRRAIRLSIDEKTVHFRGPNAWKRQRALVKAAREARRDLRETCADLENELGRSIDKALDDDSERSWLSSRNH